MGKFLLFLFLAYNYVYANDLDVLLPGTDINTLTKVKKSSQFDVNIFKRVKDNKPQVLVLVAEAHIKSDGASKLGKKMIEDFNGDFGLEGLNIDEYFMGVYFRAFIRGLYNTVAFVLNAEHSTIYDAYDIAKEQNKEVIRLEDKHKPDMLENTTFFFLSLNIVRLGYDVSKNALKFVIATSKGAYLTITEPLEAWKATKKLPGKGYDGLKKMFKPVVQACAMPLVWMGLMKPFEKEIEKPKTPFEKVADGAKKFTSYGFGSVFVLNALGYFFPSIKIGLVGGRNDTMVDTMVDHLDSQESPKPLLVIAGALHHKGFQELLKEKGFEKVEYRAK